MSLPLDVTLLVLLAALMHASWNAIAKSAANIVVRHHGDGDGAGGWCRVRAGGVRDRRAQTVAGTGFLRAIWRSSIGKLRMAASTPMPMVSIHIRRYEPVASNR